MRSNCPWLDEAHSKEAAVKDRDYVRMLVRDESIVRRMFEFPPLSREELDTQAGSNGDKPVKIVSLEIPTPGAITTPFSGTAPSFYIRARNVPIVFERVTSRELRLNTDHLIAIKHYDPRLVALDHMTRDVYDEEDRVFLDDCIGLSMGGTKNTASPSTTLTQWVEYSGGWTRANLRRLTTHIQGYGYGLRGTRALVLDTTINNFIDWGHDEAGGESSERILRGDSIVGFLSEGGNAFFHQWFQTIKADLVPQNTIFVFVPEENHARFYEYESPVAVVKRDGTELQAYITEMIGGVVANAAGHGRIDIPYT